MIKISNAIKLLESCGYSVKRNMEFDFERLPFDYADNIEFSIRRCNDILVESLYFNSLDKFMKQIQLEIPDFNKYVKRISNNKIVLSNDILDKYTSIDDFKVILDKFCYRINKLAEFDMIIGPEYNLAVNNEKYYVHLSPVNNLDKIGIEPKSSEKFETYSPRIFLFKLSELVDYDNAMENIAEDLYYSCRSIVNKFNAVYNENKTYYVYLINLDKERDIFIDNNYISKNACYTFDKIPAAFVTKITEI